MLKINLDGVEYNADDLSENGKAQAASLQFLEAQRTNFNPKYLYIKQLAILMLQP